MLFLLYAQTSLFSAFFSPKSFIPNLFLNQILQVSSVSDQSESDENESQVTEGKINFINFDFIAVEMNLFLDFKHLGDYCKNTYKTGFMGVLITDYYWL